MDYFRIADIREPSRPATSERDVLLRRLVKIRAWHPCRMASKNLEMHRTFALSSTPSLRSHGPLVQTARQSFSISAGWTIRVYLQSKLWARDGRLRFIQTTCHEFWKHSGKLWILYSRSKWRAASAASTANFAGFSFAVVLCATDRGKSRSGTEPIPILRSGSVLKRPFGKAKSGGDPSSRILLSALR